MGCEGGSSQRHGMGRIEIWPLYLPCDFSIGFVHATSWNCQKLEAVQAPARAGSTDRPYQLSITVLITHPPTLSS